MWKLKLAALVFALLVLMAAVPRSRSHVASNSHKSTHVAALLASVTEPEEPTGTTIPVTRWVEPVVRVNVALPYLWPASFRRIVPRALRWISRQTGVAFVLNSDPDAPVTVRMGPPGTGRTVFYRNVDDTLRRVEVTIGCCRARVAWEEVGQIPGIVGDGGGNDSVFSNTSTRTKPSKLDAWMLRTLYAVPPGTTAAELETRFA